MKIYVDIVCKDQFEMDIAESIIVDILAKTTSDDILDINSWIPRNDIRGAVKKAIEVKQEINKNAQK